MSPESLVAGARGAQVWAIVPAAGRGQRFGGALPKQYVEVAGQPLIAHSLQTLLTHPVVCGAVVALAADDPWWPGWSSLAGKPLLRVAGGESRAASVLAAISLKEWMVANGVMGEVRVFGSPAEEGGSGKVYLVRAGLFDDVDATIHWHPSDNNSASQGVSLANISGKFRFSGASAHASGAPWRGRSALDGVEVLNDAVNMMREHVPDGTRIHYVITDGGSAPNVVPEKAEAYYYVRHADPQIVRDVMERVKKAAEGAAMATETKVSFEQTGGVYNMLPNATLATVMDENLRDVGGVVWDAQERAFAEAMQKQLPTTTAKLESAAEVQPMKIGGAGGGSTDVADVSWVTPTVGMSAATWVPGTPGHSWQAVAAGGTSMATKGGVVAAKSMALTGAALLRDPATIEKAKAELKEKRGADFQYKAMVGDRPPPLDYRAKAGAE